jgi:putative peptidoglycan lipid II flippase
LVGYSVVRISSPVFYALGRNKTPVAVSIVTVLVNAALNLALVRVMGFRGLALGTAIAALFNASALLVLLRRSLSGLEERRVLSSLVRITIAALLMGAAAMAGDQVLARWLPGPSLAQQLLRVTGSIAVALLVLAGAAHLLRVREFGEGLVFVKRRLGRR